MAFLCRRSYAVEHKLPIIAKWINYHVVGVEPELFGKGPAEAIPLVLKKAELEVGDIDIFEINEAFANVTMYAID